jgi:Cdc6-like AAA superfamily ATPase
MVSLERLPEDLSKKWHGRKDQIQKLVNFTLNFSFGHVPPIHVSGPNGTGKTTVVRYA